MGDEVDGLDVREALDDRAGLALGLTDADVGSRPRDRHPDVGGQGLDQLGVGAHQVRRSGEPLPVPGGVLDEDGGDLLDVALGAVAVLGLRGVVEVHVRAGGDHLVGGRALEDVGE
jgi:hypothetical protein